MRALVFSVVLFCILQLELSSCNSLQEVISDFQPKLQQLRYKVRAAAATSNIRLSVASAYVSDRISISSSNVEQQLNSLQKTVEQIQETSSSVEDLQICISQEQQSASSIDGDQFSTCRRNTEIVELRRKVVVLKGLLAEIDQTVTACLVDTGVDTEALRVCLQNSVENVDTSLQEQESAIGSAIDDVIISADKCASTVEEQLEGKIAEITYNFLRCIGSSVEDTEPVQVVEIDSDETESQENDSNSSDDDQVIY